MTVSDALDLWLSPQGLRFARAARPATWHTRRHMSLHIRRILGGRDLNRLIPSDIAELQHELRGVLVASSVNCVTHTILLALLRDLEANGKLRPVVRARMKLASKLAEDRRVKLAYYTPDQRDAAIAAFGRDRPLVAFLFLTGVRRGEAAGLFRGDVDWTERSVVIERTLSRDGFTPCKTARSQRTLYLSDWAFEEILPCRDGDASAPLFTSAEGCAINMDGFANRVWHPTLRAAGLPHLNLHGTRHSWVFGALSLGLDIEDVAAQLGNTPEEVRATYDHVIRRFDPNAAVRPLVPPPVTEIVASRFERSYLRLVR